MPLVAKNPGRLDRRINFRYPVETRGVGGGVATAWAAPVTKAWGEWLPTTGREFVEAAARVDELTGMLRVRYRSDVLPTWRALVDGATYDIVAVMERGRRDYLDLMLKLAPESPAVTASAQAFEVDLAEGDINKVITYPVPFDSAPRSIYAQLVMPADGYTFTLAVLEPSRTVSGCTIEFGASVPGAGYKLSLLVTL